MKEIITDNNKWISTTNGSAIREDRSVVQEGDDDAIPNPTYGATTEIDHPDPA